MSVLVLSTDVLAAALLGALVEMAGYTPSFARPGEPARDAIRRVRPGVVLADCDYPDACGLGLIGPAKMIGVRVLLFGRPTLAAHVRERAAHFDVEVLDLPAGCDAMQRALAAPVA